EVAVLVLLVEDDPGRDVLSRRALLPGGRLAVLSAVHAVAGLDVGQRLVHEPLAARVDHEGAGQRPLGEREPGPARQEDRRAPPGVLHEGQRGARLLHVLDALTGVGRGPDGPRGGDGLTLVLVAHLLVVLEAARAHDDAAAGTEGLLLAVP